MSPAALSHKEHFVGHKVGATCFTNGKSSNNERIPYIVTGSWGNKLNELSVHCIVDPPNYEIPRQSHESGTKLIELSSISHEGGVNSMKAIQYDYSKHIITASSTGALNAYQLKTGPNVTLEQLELPAWSTLHSSACTSLDIDASPSNSTATVVSGSESGRVLLTSLESTRQEEVLMLGQDNGSVNSCRFLAGGGDRVVTAGSSPVGQLKLWDTSHSSSAAAAAAAAAPEPVLTFQDPSPGVSYRTVCPHPSHPSLFLSGNSSGEVAVWDARDERGMVSCSRVHDGDVWAVAYHPSNPNLIYSCGEDGVVRAGDLSVSTTPAAAAAAVPDGARSYACWRSLVQSVAGVNSLDVHAESNTLIAGGDGGSITVLPAI